MAAPAAQGEVTGPSMWLKMLEHSDTALAVGVVAVLAVLVIPMPPLLLDILLTVNISLGLIILMVVLNCGEPLDFSTFPSILLFTTLFRLSLNVASTRLILLHAYAGDVILSFGQFVVGGNIVVGLVVFLILVVIQFVVITKGAGRISEVAARFTLDAMPGKQMAIDADLNAGLITEHQARERREKIAKEAEFYGAMDGASKFVRGDAIAGIVITLVNILGGLLIGVMNDMPVGDAVAKYSILTVGDGLVSQIPSLIIATGAGVLITKASSKTNLSRDVTSQMTAHPRPIGIAAGLLALFALVPGLPVVPFAVMAAFFGVLYTVMKRHAAPTQEPPEPEEPQAAPGEERLEDLLVVDRLSIEVGYRLIELVEPSGQGGLLDQISAVRRKLATAMGFVVPPIRIKDNIQLDPETYVIKIRGQAVGRAQLRVDRLLAMDSGAGAQPIEGEKTTEPAFGLPAVWIAPHQRQMAEMAGYTVIEPAAVLVTHLSEVVKGHAHEILSREDAQALLDNLKERAPTVVNELVPGLLPLGAVQSVLENLLREGVPILDLTTVLETLADRANQTKDPDVLTEFVRQSLARTICSQHVDAEGKLHAIYLDGEIEQRLAQALGGGEGAGQAALDPAYTRTLIERIGKAVTEAYGRGLSPVVLTAAPLRRHVQALVGPTLRGVAVLSYNEVLPTLDVEVAATVSLREESEGKAGRAEDQPS
ncbi:MAG: flagellar biosynthesis protein FlhA [Candidatus Brocadiia bacterium]